MSAASSRAHDIIRDAILGGRFAAGEALTESSLAAIAGVSRTPVREALLQLEAEGLITRSSTGRLSVADWQSADLDDLFTLRAMLEGHTAERAARRIDAAGITALKAANSDLSAALSNGPDIDAFLSANRCFHDIVIAAAASDHTATMLSQLVEQPLVRATAHRYDRTLFERSYKEHAELISALERGDGAWARAVMTGHIRRAYHALADIQEETS